jgi:hypothetical protein
MMKMNTPEERLAMLVGSFTKYSYLNYSRSIMIVLDVEFNKRIGKIWQDILLSCTGWNSSVVHTAKVA